MLKLCGVSERKNRNEMIFVSRTVNFASQKSFLGPAKPVLRIRAERFLRHCEEQAQPVTRQSVLRQKGSRIATAFGLAMTRKGGCVRSGSLWLPPLLQHVERTWSPKGSATDRGYGLPCFARNDALTQMLRCCQSVRAGAQALSGVSLTTNDQRPVTIDRFCNKKRGKCFPRRSMRSILLCRRGRRRARSASWRTGTGRAWAARPSWRPP